MSGTSVGRITRRICSIDWRSGDCGGVRCQRDHGMGRPAESHQSAVHGKDLFVDDGSDGQAVEAVGKRLPQLDVVAALACGAKAERMGESASATHSPASGAHAHSS